MIWLLIGDVIAVAISSYCLIEDGYYWDTICLFTIFFQVSTVLLDGMD